MLGMAMVALLAWTPPASADIGTTPGTYTHYAFPDGADEFENVTWSTRVDTDPGSTSHVFWSHQFDFNKGDGAYIGMQTNGKQEQLLLFSVWGAREAKKGDENSFCDRFGGEGEGYTCRTWTNWNEGQNYEFRVEHEGDNWFGASVTNTDTGESIELGSIRNTATAISASGMVDWTEYYEWNDGRATCHDQPYSAATFGLPRANDGQVTGAVSKTTSSDNECKDMTETAKVDGGSVQRLALGNSVRGAVTGPGGRCLGAEGEITDGAETGVRECAATMEQSWISSADKTLRLVSDHCLTAEKGGVVVRDCAGTPHDGVVSDEAKLWEYDSESGSLRNVAAGQCLAAGPENALALHRCDGAQDQRWTLPPTP